MEFAKNFENIFEKLNSSVSHKNNIIEILDIEKNLLKNTKLTPLIRDINKNNWIKLDIKENERHWFSDKNSKLITVWKQEIPEYIKQQWSMTNNSNEDIKSYIFSHENSHHMLWYMFEHQDKFPMFAKLYNKLKGFRENNLQHWKYIGLSQIGSTKTWNGYFYYNNWTDKNWNITHTAHDEDLVELFNKYCINPKIFKKYLSYLVNTNKNSLNKQWLMQISQSLADWLYEDISNAIALFLKENWKVQQIIKK